jgi:hypothetical protein
LQVFSLKRRISLTFCRINIGSKGIQDDTGKGSLFARLHYNKVSKVIKSKRIENEEKTNKSRPDPKAYPLKAY